MSNPNSKVNFRVNEPLGVGSPLPLVSDVQKMIEISKL